MFNDFFAQLLDQLQTVRDRVIAYIPQLIAGLLVGAIAVVCVRLIRRWAERIALRTEAPPEVERLIINSVCFSSIVVGLTITLSVLGVNVMGMIAGLGLSGLVVGFALKDIFENLLAGALILIQRPFIPGHIIEIGDIMGTVTNVEIRATTLRTYDNVEVVIPNRTVYSSVIQNLSTYPTRRRQVSLGFGYGENLGEAIQILMDRLQNTNGVAVDPAPFVTLDDFGAFLRVQQIATNIIGTVSATSASTVAVGGNIIEITYVDPLAARVDTMENNTCLLNALTALSEINIV